MVDGTIDYAVSDHGLCVAKLTVVNTGDIIARVVGSAGRVRAKLLLDTG